MTGRNLFVSACVISRAPQLLECLYLPTSKIALAAGPMKSRAIRSLNGGEQSPRLKEDIMHPAITQAVTAERSRDRQAHAAAWQRAREIRRSRRARQVIGTRRAVRGPWVRRVLRAA